MRCLLTFLEIAEATEAHFLENEKIICCDFSHIKFFFAVS